MAEDDAPLPYAAYQTELYNGAIMHKQLVITTDPNKLQEETKKVMKPETFNYIAGGAGGGSGMDANRLAFRQWKLIPRMLCPTSPRDPTVELFSEIYRKTPFPKNVLAGRTLFDRVVVRSPMILGPVGVQSAYHPDGDTGVAEACAELGVPYTYGSAATRTIEEVYQASGNGPRWFQLYWPMNNGIIASLLGRGRGRAGAYKVLVATLDTATMSWRAADLDLGYLLTVVGRRGLLRDSHAWGHLEVSCGGTGTALEHGVQGIVVSNHGGRQVDDAVGALEVLPEIVDAVGDRMTVPFDSGIRTGSDIMKVLCLVARPVMYGLSIAGKEGARHIMASLLAEPDGAVGLAGIKSIADLDRLRVRRVVYGGDIKSNL
ncbi:hypothetical protein DL769_011434 [Monosporascus sp. CRB-8-3]|nr:hypothetical protein DL769_011434 [Monosporascus sp. CRB-8-3]